MTRRAKIVCTLGPATSTAERVRGLVDAGMDVARLNVSHGTHAEHESVYHLVRQAAESSGRAVDAFDGVLVARGDLGYPGLDQHAADPRARVADLMTAGGSA